MLALNPKVPFMFLQPLAVFSLSLFLSFYWWASRPSIPPHPISPPLPMLSQWICCGSYTGMPKACGWHIGKNCGSPSHFCLGLSVLIPLADHLLVCCYLDKFTGVPCTLSLFWSLFLWNSNIWVLKSLFLKSSWFAACLISSGSLFPLSTVLTKNENFLWSVIMVSVNAGWPVQKSGSYLSSFPDPEHVPSPCNSVVDQDPVGSILPPPACFWIENICLNSWAFMLYTVVI